MCDMQSVLTEAIESIKVLYLKPNSSQDARMKADKFLTELRQSAYAWQVADQLLRMKAEECYSYFGAQTMRNKIQSRFEELPVDSHIGLKDSLMSHLRSIDQTTYKTVSNQLCLAIADLFCHMVQWRQALDDIVALYRENPELISVLLDVLRYIPEEYQNKSLRIGNNRKRELLAEMERCRLHIIAMTCAAFSLNKTSVQEKAIQCLNSWFVSGILRDDDVISTGLIQEVFRLLHEPFNIDFVLFQAASQCASDFFASDIQAVPQLTNLFQIETYKLGDRYVTCSKNGRLEYCVEYAKIFCGMGSAFLPMVLDAPVFENVVCPGNVQTIDLLLLAAETNRDCCTLVLDMLTELTEHTEVGTNDVVREALAPKFEELIYIMTLHCATIEHEDDQLLCDFRAQVFFVMEQIRMFFNPETVFRKLLSDLSHLLHQSESSSARNGGAEAYLWMISSLVKYVNCESPENAAVLEDLLTNVVLPFIGNEQSSFQNVAFTMFGELWRWISTKEAMMRHVLSVMVAFITQKNVDQSKELELSAFNACLKALSVYCKRQSLYVLHEHWNHVMMVCERFPNFDFVSKEMGSFYEALGKCLCVPINKNALVEIKMTPGELGQRLRLLCEVNWNVILFLYEHGSQSKSPRDPRDPCVWIDNLAALFISMLQMHTGKNSSRMDKTVADARRPFVLALYSVFHEFIWPMISHMITIFIGDGRILERVVRLLRYCQRCFQTLTKPLLHDVAVKIIEAYTSSGESCFLYFGGILVDEFGDDPECKDGLITMFHSFFIPAHQILQSVDALNSNPNTTEDLFRLTVRLIQHCSPAFLASDRLNLFELLDMALRVLTGPNLDSKQLALRVLAETLSCAGRQGCESVRGRVIDWLLSSIEGVGGRLPQLTYAVLYQCRWCCDDVDELLDDLTDVVTAIRALVDAQQFTGAVHAALDSIGVARPDGLMYATGEQVCQLVQALQKDSRVADGLQQFAHLFS